MVTASKLGPPFVSASEVPAIDEILLGLPVGPDPGSLTEETRLDFVEILLHCFALDFQFIESNARTVLTSDQPLCIPCGYIEPPIRPPPGFCKFKGAGVG